MRQELGQCAAQRGIDGGSVRAGIAETVAHLHHGIELVLLMTLEAASSRYSSVDLRQR